MVQYIFREPLPLRNGAKLDAQKIGESFERLAAENGGRLEPDAVWKAAQNPRHVAHKAFIWDVRLAAEAHWRSTARLLIRSLRIEETEDAGEQPAFLSIAQAEGVSYRRVQDVVASSDLQVRLLRQAQRDLEAWRQRYRVISDICEDIAEAEKKIAERITKAEGGKLAAA